MSRALQVSLVCELHAESPFAHKLVGNVTKLQLDIEPLKLWLRAEDRNRPMRKRLALRTPGGHFETSLCSNWITLETFHHQFMFYAAALLSSDHTQNHGGTMGNRKWFFRVMS